jgi:hypothetical protein
LQATGEKNLRPHRTAKSGSPRLAANSLGRVGHIRSFFMASGTDRPKLDWPVSGSWAMSMQGDRLSVSRRAAAQCLDLALRTQDPNMRTSLLAMAQRWLEFSSEELGAGLFHDLLQEFNNQQMLNTKRR